MHLPKRDLDLCQRLPGPRGAVHVVPKRQPKTVSNVELGYINHALKIPPQQSSTSA